MISKRIATVGMFDGVHIGHQHILRQLLQESEFTGLAPLVVTFDVHPRVLLHTIDDDFRLLTTDAERVALLRQQGVEDIHVVHFTQALSQLSACAFFQEYLVAKLNVGALLLGYDNAFGSKRHNDFDQLASLAMRCGVELFHDSAVCYADTPVSSTQIRRALAEGRVSDAQAMLGYHYGVEGYVVKGKQLGHRFGFPTANVAIDDPFKAIPAEGVYAVLAETDSCRWGGVANLGPQPTFHGAHSVLEAHLFDCAENLYGSRLRIRFVERLRDIVAFESVEALSRQIELDGARARASLSRVLVSENNC